MSLRLPSCAGLSRAFEEAPLGTAERVDTWLLQELPAPWIRDPLTDPHLPAPLYDRARSFLRETQHPRVVFIRRDACVLKPTIIRVRSAGTPPTTEIVAPLDEAGVVSMGDRLLFLVCTHGQHDSCCGTFGYPVYATLRALAPADVWQCSHIGGDRFAANIVVLPWGLYFGHVAVSEVEVLVEHLRRRDVPLRWFRGRSTLSRPAQVGEIYLRREGILHGMQPPRVTSVERRSDSAWRVVIHDATNAFSVDFREERAAVARRLTCGATEEGMPREYRLLSVQKQAAI
ncbi:MAG TPA: sucrase ferredoxin [Thermoanaerobaculia bacterium]|jgi:hypothetical protein